MADPLIEGWEDIGKMFGWSKPTIMKRKDELCDAGVVFYLNRGRPPRNKACAWESALKIWAMKKGAKGERL